MIARGELFGKRPVILHLLDVPFCQEALHGVVLEIQDCAFPLLKDVVATTDVKTAFTGVDVAILVGAFPRKDGMERKDLLEKNIAIFKEQGKAINDYASKGVKVLVVGNPANTNALIAQISAPDVPKTSFSALTRLDHNRALYQLAVKSNTEPHNVRKVTIWGNHSKTQFPDASNATLDGKKATEVVNDTTWLQTTFVTSIQNRGAEVIKARKFSSAASAAKAIIDHLHDWIFGTPENDWVSMAVPSDGSYGIKEGIIFSYPVVIKDGHYKIVQDLHIDDFARQKINETEQELREERETAYELLGLKK